MRNRARFCPICPTSGISIKMAFSLEKGVMMGLHMVQFEKT